MMYPILEVYRYEKINKFIYACDFHVMNTRLIKVAICKFRERLRDSYSNFASNWLSCKRNSLSAAAGPDSRLPAPADSQILS